MARHIFILIFISLIALWPFFRKGYFESHDGEWMVIRFSAFHQALTNGQFPTRYVERLNNNYGYPVLNFLYPLPFYLAEIPKLAGFGFVDSIKIVFVLSTVSSIVAMYWALTSIFSKTAALTGALIYLFIPYRFVDLYVRGSLGESLAFVFVPLVAGAILKIAQGDKKFIPVLSIAIASLIISHNVIAILMIPFFLILSFILMGKKISALALPSILGICMAAFFWIPAFYDLQFVRLSEMKVSEITHHLVDFPKLIVPNWGYGPNPNDPQGLSIQIGIVALFIFLTAVVILSEKTRSFMTGMRAKSSEEERTTAFRPWESIFLKSKTKEKIILYLLVTFFLILFANTKYSAFFWQTVPAADVIQFPWRMHSILIFITAFLAAYVIDSANRKILLPSLVIIAAIASTFLYIKPAVFIDRGDNYYATNEDTTNSRDEYLPLWVKEKPKERAEAKLKLLGSGSIQDQKVLHLNYRAQVSSNEPTTLQVATIYFPDFAAKVDGQKVPINYQNELGLMRVQLPRGNHEVIINYTRSPVHAISELVSLVSILTTGVICYFLYSLAENRRVRFDG